MELLNVPRLRNNQLQSLAEGSIVICKEIPELKPSIDEVKKRLKEFIEGMLKAKTSAKYKKLTDDRRDSLTKGTLRQIITETHFPHSKKEAIEVIKSLERVSKKYGFSITRLSYNEQTAATENLIADLKKINIDELPDNSIARWIPLLENANNDFKIAAGEYLSESANNLAIDSATNLAPALSESIEALFAMLFAHSKINATEPLLKANTELKVLIDSYK